MKILADGTEVSPRSYYYLLDYNDRTNWDFMIHEFNQYKLHDLNIHQYLELFEYATKSDIEIMKSKIS